VRVDRHAIGAAGQHAILDLLVGIQFAGQQPADREQHHDHDERDQRLAARGSVPTGIVIVVWHGATSCLKTLQNPDGCGKPAGEARREIVSGARNQSHARLIVPRQNWSIQPTARRSLRGRSQASMISNPERVRSRNDIRPLLGISARRVEPL